MICHLSWWNLPLRTAHCYSHYFYFIFFGGAYNWLFLVCDRSQYLTQQPASIGSLQGEVQKKTLKGALKINEQTCLFPSYEVRQDITLICHWHHTEDWSFTFIKQLLLTMFTYFYWVYIYLYSLIVDFFCPESLCATFIVYIVTALLFKGMLKFYVYKMMMMKNLINHLCYLFCTASCCLWKIVMTD